MKKYAWEKEAKKRLKELLPCPCCGGDAGFSGFGISPDKYVSCRDCGLHTSGDHTTLDAVIAAWNKRVYVEVKDE